MKTQMLILLALLLTLADIPAQSAGPAYIRKMKTTLDQMHKAQTLQEHVAVANTFSVIAQTEPDEWLPRYYHAHLHIMMIYVDNEATDDVKEKYLATARESVLSLLDTHPEEAEVQALDGWYWISRIGLKPMVYGMLYIGNYNSAIERALKLEPENPRARFLDLSNKIGKAEWFGSDISEYCAEVDFLMDHWDDYEIKSELHPTWGKQGLQSQADKCRAHASSN